MATHGDEGEQMSSKLRSLCGESQQVQQAIEAVLFGAQRGNGLTSIEGAERLAQAARTTALREARESLAESADMAKQIHGAKSPYYGAIMGIIGGMLATPPFGQVDEDGRFHDVPGSR